MKKLLLIYILFIFNFALANEFVVDISDNLVEIDTNFSGKKLILFGSKGAEEGEIMILIMGPKKNFLARKKEKLYGIWLNNKKQLFAEVDSFYLTGASADALSHRKELFQKNIGLTSQKPKLNDLEKAFVKHMHDNDLYSDFETKVEFLSNSLFKFYINLPKNLPTGSYNVEIYMVQDDTIKSIRHLKFDVKKIGFEAYVEKTLYESPVNYAFFAIFIALFGGWVGANLFKKI